jgi:NADH dehydrogenase
MRRVLILGGGSAGYAAAKVLIPALANRSEATLTLISNRPQAVIRSLLPEVVAGSIAPQYALSELSGLRDTGPIEIHTETVLAVDPVQQEVTTDRATHAYDYLLVASGSHPVPTHPELEPLADDIDAVRLRHRLASFDPNGEDAPRVGIVGGGPFGVDLAGTLATRFREGAEHPCEITLYERGSQLLSDFPQEFGQYAASTLEGLGVAVELETIAEPDSCHPADVLIWTGGVEPVADFDLGATPKNDEGKLQVDEFLRVEGYPNIFSAGSMADPPHRPDNYPQGTPLSVRSGVIAAKNIQASMCGRSFEALRADQRLIATTVGRHHAIALLFGLVVQGRPAHTLCRLELARSIPGLAEKLGLVAKVVTDVFRL